MSQAGPVTSSANQASTPVARDAETGAYGSGAFPRLLAWLLTAGGAIGLGAAGVLMLEKIALLKDPAYIPTCSLNPVLSCGSVMVTPQAEAFGVPNPLVGVVGFTAVVSCGVVLLARAVLPRWFWLGLQAGTTFGVVFVHWLIFQSLYRIGALCPYCMAVWAVMIPIFLYMTLHNATAGHLGDRTRPVGTAIARHHLVLLTVWYLAIVALVLQRFWTYWQSLL